VESIFLTAIFHVLMIKTLGTKFNPICGTIYVITKHIAMKEIKIKFHKLSNFAKVFYEDVKQG
jgi:hypothetical protein